MWVSDECFLLTGPTNIGLVRTGEGQAVLIDSGGDDSSGRRIRKALEADGMTLQAIYNTHSHADHIGGNAFLQTRLGCRIYAPDRETAFVRQPSLEIHMLYGSPAPDEFNHKIFVARESQAEPLSSASLPEGMQVIPLPGHSMDMVGFRTREDIVFLADCLVSHETLSKYAISYLWDLDRYKETLQQVCGMQARLFVPAHAAPCVDIRPLAMENLRHVADTEEKILELCREPATWETLLRGIFLSDGLHMTAAQHVLVGSTLKGYLTSLVSRGAVRYFFEDARMLWERI